MLKYNLKTFIFIIIILSFSLNYIIYDDFSFPSHADEFTHMALSRDMVESRSIRATHPYFDDETTITRTQTGFNVFLSLIYILHGESLRNFVIFRDIVFSLNAILVFLLVYKISKDKVMALISSLFFMSIRTTSDFLGNALLIPMTLGLSLFLISMIVYLMYKETKENRFISILILTYGLLILTHPPSAILFFLILLIDIRREVDSRKGKNNRALNRLSYIMMSMISYLAIYMWYWSETSLRNIVLDYIIFNQSWTQFVELTRTPFVYFGIVGSVLATLGLFVLFSRKVKVDRVVMIWASLAIVNVSLFYILGYSLFIPGRRMIFYLAIIMSILSGVGIGYLLKKIDAQIRKLKMKKKSRIRKFTLILIVVVIIALQFVPVFIDNMYNPRSIIDEDRYDLIKRAHERFGNDNVIMTDPSTGFTVYPMTGNKVVGLYHSNLAPGNLEEVREYFRTRDCSTKQYILENNDVEIVITDREERCDILEKVESSGKYTLYYFPLPKMLHIR